MRNQSTIEEFHQIVEDFSNEEGGVLPLERQPIFHCTIHDQNLSIKVDITHCIGEEQSKVLDSLNEVERIFEFLNLPENKRVKLVDIKLKRHASSWCQQVQITRVQSRRIKSSGLKCNSKFEVNSLH